MLRIILIGILLTGCVSPQYYAKLGAGWKFDESNQSWYHNGTRTSNTPISARAELGAEIDAGPFVVSGGLSHHSQWTEGWPVNDHGEYYKTELFIDVKYVFN